MGITSNDLLDESGFFILPTELINEFNLKCTFLQAYGIVCAQIVEITE